MATCPIIFADGFGTQDLSLYTVSGGSGTGTPSFVPGAGRGGRTALRDSGGLTLGNSFTWTGAIPGIRSARTRLVAMSSVLADRELARSSKTCCLCASSVGSAGSHRRGFCSNTWRMAREFSGRSVN